MRSASPQPGLGEIAREWGRIGCVGFGGPPAHINLLRELCVKRRGWLSAHEFEDAIAACNLLPGPASTQLAIFCAWKVGGGRGALLGGLGFVLPGPWPLLAVAAAASGGLLALAWTAFKVGALSYGGGFVIVPLMQGDAVDRFHWMTDSQFLNAVALGQVTPGPVTHTVAGSATRLPGSAGRCWQPSSPSCPRSPSSSWAPATSTGCAATPACSPSSTAPVRPPSARSSAPRSRSPWR